MKLDEPGSRPDLALINTTRSRVISLSLRGIKLKSVQTLDSKFKSYRYLLDQIDNVNWKDKVILRLSILLDCP